MLLLTIITNTNPLAKVELFIENAARPHVFPRWEIFGTYMFWIYKQGIPYIKDNPGGIPAVNG